MFESKEAEDNGKEDEIEEGDDEEQSMCQGYSIAQHPAYSQLPIALLIEDFGATDFIAHLTTFLCHSPQTSHTERRMRLKREMMRSRACAKDTQLLTFVLTTSHVSFCLHCAQQGKLTQMRDGIPYHTAGAALSIFILLMVSRYQ